MAERTKIDTQTWSLSIVLRTHALKTIEFSGRVFSGQSEGRKFIELTWVKRQIREKLGFIPYPGTLNVRLSEESTQRRKFLDDTEGMRICPSEGYCSGLLFKARVGILECGIVVPQVEGYPLDVLEVIASVNLKEKLGLRDGDEITITVHV